MTRKIPIFSSLDDACRACDVLPRDGGAMGFTVANVEGGRRGRGSGRIRYFADNAGGYVKNWTDGREALFFYGYRQGQRIPADEYRARMDELRRMLRKEAEERAKLQKTMAELAANILAASRPCSGHPYLVRKHVAGVLGAPCMEISADEAQSLIWKSPAADDGQAQKVEYLGARLLVVPLTLEDAAPVSLQLINAKGQKTFLKGGRIKGTFWRPTDMPVKSESVETIGLAEGVATALAVRRLFNIPCFAGISAGNLIHAAESLRMAYPRAKINLFADRDESKAGEDGARAAACAISNSALYICPAFDAAQRAKFKKLTGGNKPTDFNDLMIIKEAF